MVLISPHAMQATRAPTTVSVFADCSIPAGLRIGPVPGIFKLGKYVSDRKEVGPKKKVRLVRGEFVDESGCPVPDWIGLIRAARNSQEQNLEAVSDLPGGQIFYRVLREIPSGEELSVWYSNALAQWYDIPTTATPTHDEKGEERYICWYCWRIFKYPNTLKAHVHFHCALSNGRGFLSSEQARGTETFTRSPKSGDIPNTSTSPRSGHSNSSISDSGRRAVSSSPFLQKVGLSKKSSTEEQDRALDMSVTSARNQGHILGLGATSSMLSSMGFHPGCALCLQTHRSLQSPGRGRIQRGSKHEAEQSGVRQAHWKHETNPQYWRDSKRRRQPPSQVHTCNHGLLISNGAMHPGFPAAASRRGDVSF
ncbi:hypothetical protein CesoFtcFv8_013146 [Champsocephalus esox]|uniref:PR domain containing 13 n=1 Tax=Champsocephalus esox TaxID=159716 RepID=A0AAN8GYK9_9TELE|nr:hypothetical protein CesoFtcFv8_013146 [Champsocephalus esox]